MTSLILAFDGLVADTIELRADALQLVLAAEGMNVERSHVLEALPGRTLHEAISTLIGRDDETLLDLTALRAQKEVSTRMARGVSLKVNARAFIDARRVAGTRLVLRADSLRRDVERVLQLTDLEFAFTLVRCADDLPRAREVGTLEGSYAAIRQRLDALRVEHRRALEFSAHAADVARRRIGHGQHAECLEVSAQRR